MRDGAATALSLDAIVAMLRDEAAYCDHEADTAADLGQVDAWYTARRDRAAAWRLAADTITGQARALATVPPDPEVRRDGEGLRDYTHRKMRYTQDCVAFVDQLRAALQSAPSASRL